MVAGKLLSDEELESLGVKRFRDGRYDVYEFPCDVCGRKTRSHNFDSTHEHKCRVCKKSIEDKYNRKRYEVKRKHEAVLAEELEIDVVRFRRFEKAVTRFGLEYYYAIKQAETAMAKFDSVPEVIACIELLYIGVRVIPHKSLGRLTVDFCLPDEKIVVEIDGSLYHKNAEKEYRRDLAILNMLGDGWVIKHIPAESVDKNHKAFGRLMKRFIDERRFELCIK